MLEVVNVTHKFGGLYALQDVSFKLKEKSIMGLIGPNGSGKTTLINVISGIYKPVAGKILLEGKDITGLKPNDICKMGILRTFQIPRLFLRQTVLDNVMYGALFGRKKPVSLSEAREDSLYFLNFVGLGHKKNLMASQINVYERKMVELAMALNALPRVLLLDELVAGANPQEMLFCMEIVKKIRDEFGITILWIEHVMKAIMNVAETIVVLNFGKKIAEGSPKEIARNKEVIEAYLGAEYKIG
ncbi:MAG: ABC transporter ATP-binding protein [Candidatus Bathyarchaeia archaeon]